jgi:hypothetical protein
MRRDAARRQEAAYVEKSTVVSHGSIRGIMAQDVPRIMAEKSTVKYTTVGGALVQVQEVVN